MLLDVFLFAPCFRQFTHIHLKVELRCSELTAREEIDKSLQGASWFLFDCHAVTLPGLTSAFFTVMLLPLILCSLTCKGYDFVPKYFCGKMRWEENWLTSVDLSSPSSVLYKMKANPRDRPYNESIAQEKSDDIFPSDLYDRGKLPVIGSIFSLTESNSPNFPKYSCAQRLNYL